MFHPSRRDLLITPATLAAGAAIGEQIPLFARDNGFDNFTTQRKRECYANDYDQRLKIYPGLPHGLMTTNADMINADILAFIRS